MTLRLLSLATTGVLLTVACAAAQPATNQIAAGRALADAQCSQCHRTTGGGPAGWTDVPSFAVIANRPATTAAWLRGIIETPQGEMLHTGRSAADANALAAYIMTMRGKAP